MSARGNSLLGDEAFRLMVEAAGEYAIYLLDRDGTIASWNETAERVKGFSATEVVGRPFEILFSEEERRDGRPAELLERARSEGRVELEERRRRKDGSPFWALLTITPLFEARDLVGYSIVLRDISPRRRQATLLRLKNAELAEASRIADEHVLRLRTLLDHTPAGMAFLDGKGRYVEVNECLAQMLEHPRTAFFGKRLVETVPQPMFGDVLERVLGGEAVSRVELEVVTSLGKRHWNSSYHPIRDEDGEVVGAALFVVDETDRRRAEADVRALEEKLRQAQKLEAIGQLAGGVAHDFNNLLTVISVYSDQLLTRFGPGDPNHEAAAAIRDAGERAASLTSQLLAFSRKAMVEPKVIDFNEAVGRVSRMVRRLIGEDIEVLTRLASELSTIRIDPTQAEQIILNLAVNARDAMPQGGRLVIATRNTAIAPGDPALSPGRYAELEVRDNGTGMSPEVRARIFEPFFTTKELGKGTGLGLATVYGIVKQANGHIEVSSELGQGTTFRVLLPSVDRPPTTQTVISTRPARGTETVLLVEDEDMVRRVARRTLEHHGYHVLDAPTGHAALEIMRTHEGVIHLLLTDVVMPGMNGRKLAETIRARRPEIKVLFMSGYTEDASAHQHLLEAPEPFLAKPFTPRTLTHKVRSVLDG